MLCTGCKAEMPGYDPSDEGADLCDACHEEARADKDDGSDDYAYEMEDM